MDKDTMKGLPQLLQENAVVKITDNGRERVFAHRDMQSATKRPSFRAHTFAVLDDLISYAKKEHGDHSALFFDDAMVVLVLDEEWNENKSTFAIKTSKAVKRWIADIKSQSGLFSQEKLIDFLECWPEEVVGIYPEGNNSTADLSTVIQSLIKLEMAVKITYDKSVKDQNNTKLNFLVEESENGEGVKTGLPKNWKIKIPVLEGAEPEELQIRLCYKVPRDQGQDPVFYFECPKLASHIEQGVDKIGERLRTELADIPVYKGQP